MIKMTKIQINWSENGLFGEGMIFNSLQEANEFMLANASNFAEGGYDKTDIEVTWEDGDTYGYRGDLSSPTGNCYNSIEYHMGENQKCYYLPNGKF